MTGILKNFLGTQGAQRFTVKDVGKPWKEGFNSEKKKGYTILF